MGDRSNPELVNHVDALRTILQGVAMWNRTAEASNMNRIESIMMALDFGGTWEHVGKAMGMSRQAANKRFGQAVKELRASRAASSRRG